MFGNLAALSWSISLFAPSFQLQFAIMRTPISLQCDPLSCISFIYRMRELSFLYYYRLLEQIRAEASFLV